MRTGKESNGQNRMSRESISELSIHRTIHGAYPITPLLFRRRFYLRATEPFLRPLTMRPPALFPLHLSPTAILLGRQYLLQFLVSFVPLLFGSLRKFRLLRCSIGSLRPFDTLRQGGPLTHRSTIRSSRSCRTTRTRRPPTRFPLRHRFGTSIQPPQVQLVNFLILFVCQLQGFLHLLGHSFSSLLIVRFFSGLPMGTFAERRTRCTESSIKTSARLCLCPLEKARKTCCHHPPYHLFCFHRFLFLKVTL